MSFPVGEPSPKASSSQFAFEVLPSLVPTSLDPHLQPKSVVVVCMNWLFSGKGLWLSCIVTPLSALQLQNLKPGAFFPFLVSSYLITRGVFRERLSWSNKETVPLLWHRTERLPGTQPKVVIKFIGFLFALSWKRLKVAWSKSFFLWEHALAYQL